MGLPDRLHSMRAQIDPRDGALAFACHPECAGRRLEANRVARDRNAADDPVGLGIELEQRIRADRNHSPCMARLDDGDKRRQGRGNRDEGSRNKSPPSRTARRRLGRLTALEAARRARATDHGGGCAVRARAAQAPAPARARQRAPPAAPVGSERIRLPAAAIEREHELSEQTLTRRVIGDERLELRHERRPLAGVELGRDPLLARRDSELVELSRVR